MKRKILYILIASALLLAISPVAFAHMGTGLSVRDPLDTAPEIALSDTGVYIVVMQEDPVVSYEGDILGYQATRPSLSEKLDPNSAPVRQYSGRLQASHEQALLDVGVSPDQKIYDYTIALNGFAARLSESEAAALAKQAGVVLVLPDQMRFPTTENTPTFLGLNARGGPWDSGILGEGVVVGVIDTGIWPEHPSFADDGSFAPPPITLDESKRSACDFGNTAANPADAPFTCNNKLIGARLFLDTYKAVIGLEPREYDSARDDNGHGTHTASTAAGNSGVEASIFGIDRGIVSGMAPQAHVVMYKGCAALGCFTSDLAAAIDQAVADGVDVINYSIGGGASLLGADDIAFLFAADAGVFVATSAGNSGPGASTIGGPASVPWITSVGASTHTRTFAGSVGLDDGSKFGGASITPGTDLLPLVDSEDLGNELCDPNVAFNGDIYGKIVLCRRGAFARVEKSRAVFEQGGAGMVLYNVSDTQSQVTDNHWVPSVHVNNTDGMAIKAYIDSAGSGAMALINGGMRQRIPGSWLADFSSRGPNPAAGDIIKPDVTAPGVNVLAGNSPTPDLGAPGQLFQSISGTSMSSPHVAGVYALIKQAHPDWSPAMAKSALMTTSRQDVFKEDGTTPADPFDMGAGHIDPGGRWGPGSITSPGLVYDAGFLDYLGFLCDAAPEAFADPAGTCSFLESIGIPTDASDLNYPSIGIAELPGSQTVVRTVTSVASHATTFRSIIDEPPGYDVTVSPRILRLRPGESATYWVTVTNDGTGAIDEWAFGSLTWRSGRYTAYSPIAIKGSLFNAPAEISASGTSGSASFDVQFGYTGVYTAAAHGLEPATLTMDNVLQDPNQSFSPGDVAAGGANLHQFSLSGAAHFRIAMPPEATEPGADLDIFVFDPNGAFVASSTSAGTDELIDISLPMDGTWSVYVHGWLTPGGDSDYTLYTWVVSATPGGSLTIDSAPASATLGQSGTIDVSWSGLASGTQYLGAVSHSDSSGILGLTLVSVDTD